MDHVMKPNEILRVACKVGGMIQHVPTGTIYTVFGAESWEQLLVTFQKPSGDEPVLIRTPHDFVYFEEVIETGLYSVLYEQKHPSLGEAGVFFFVKTPLIPIQGGNWM